MDRKHKIVISSIASILSLMSANVAYASSGVAATPENEKCFGIVKKGMNDCQTAAQSCASSSTVDNQGDAFVFLPKGVCHKIVGASLQPIATMQPNMPQTDMPGMPSSQNPSPTPEKNIPEEERD